MFYSSICDKHNKAKESEENDTGRIQKGLQLQ